MVSVVATAVTLLGAALLYAVTGTVHLGLLRRALAGGPACARCRWPRSAVVLVAGRAGVQGRRGAVPRLGAGHLRRRAAAGRRVPVHRLEAGRRGRAARASRSTALRRRLDVAGPALAVLAVLTMTVGNLVALRQRRMVRLLAWSSVAQAGYILAPLGALALAAGRTSSRPLRRRDASAYTVFFVVLELGAFAAVVALRGARRRRRRSTDYRGAARRRPWVSAAFVLALAGLAGLPPGLAGLFAKVTVVRALLDGSAGWLALVVALNAVIGLAYYVRASAALFGRSPRLRLRRCCRGRGCRSPRPRGRSRSASRCVVTVVALVLGFAPQLVLDAVS